MAARMAYFRVKWRTLADGYRRFLSDRLQPGRQRPVRPCRDAQ